MDSADSNPAQKRFDDTYISAGEICRELHVTRPTVTHAQKRGMLPQPVIVSDCQLYLWERSIVRPYLDAWKLNLRARRGELVAEQSA